MAEQRGEVTSALAEAKLGRKDALDRLIPLVYRELRRIAGQQMQRERVGHTLQPTALVHEAFSAWWTRVALTGRTARNFSGWQPN